MNLPPQNRSSLSILFVLALGLCAIYCIPFYVPVRDELSASFLFGYNNRTAILLLAALTIGFALWTRGLGLTLPDPAAPSQDPIPNKWAGTVACLIVGCGIMWLVARLLLPFGEAQYFLDRYEMFRMGGRLFRDFEFDYGPLMFYLPVWISRIFHLTLANSYYLAWTVQWGLGGWVLWKTVTMAAKGTPNAHVIYQLLWVFFAFSILDSGTNYTPLRFASPLLFALTVWNLYTRGANRLITFSFASSAATALLFYSPEQGIAFTLGTLLYFLVCVRNRRPGTLTALACFCCVMASALWLAHKVGDLDNARTVGAGVMNFPILFSFQTLVLLLLVVVSGCVVVAGFRTHTSGHPLLYLICLSVVSMPAAFSRADVGHIILNTLGALIAALVVLSQYPKAWQWTWVSFATVIVLATYAHAHYYLGEVRIEEAFAKLTYNPQARNGPDPTTVPLPERANLFAPLGVRRQLTHVARDPSIVTGRYPWLFPLTSLGRVQEGINELKSHPDWPLLLPTREPPACVEDPNEMRLVMKRVLLAPYIPKPRSTVDAAIPFCDYLQTHYVLSNYQSPVLGYFVWVPNGDSRSAP